MTRDGAYRASVAAASGHHLPHSGYLEWDADDRQAEDEVTAYDAERCPDCSVHPDQWSPKYGADIRRPKVQPKWVYCAICFLLAKESKRPPEKDEQGNPGPGWRLTLVPRGEVSDERTSQERGG